MPEWRLASALVGGTSAMRTAGKTYMPKWPNEDERSYATRLSVAVLFPAYKRTVETLTGKPFSKPIRFEADVPARIQEWMEDADLRGRNLHVFCADILEAVLSHGLAGILVDFPPTTGIAQAESGIITQAEEAAVGLRPYFVEVKPEQILGWRSERINGVETLIQLRIMETISEHDGDFGSKDIEQVRVLTPGAWEIWRKRDGISREEWALYEGGTTTLNEIPFTPIYGDRRGFMEGRPPLIELAYMNVEHWQSASDQQNVLHVARVPILAVTGIDDDSFQVTVGASNAINLPMSASMQYVEHTGAAIGAGKQSLDDLEERMRQAGAELMVVKPNRVTAFQVGVENDLAMSALQRISQDFQDALNQALQFMADWVGEPEGGHVVLFNDFGAANLTQASMQYLVQAAAAGKVSDETLFGEMQRRNEINPTINWVDERARLDAQGPALGMIGADSQAAPQDASSQ